MNNYLEEIWPSYVKTARSHFINHINFVFKYEGIVYPSLKELVDIQDSDFDLPLTLEYLKKAFSGFFAKPKKYDLDQYSIEFIVSASINFDSLVKFILNKKLLDGKDSNIIKVGSFEVVSEKLRIADPCYELSTESNNYIDNIKNGQYNCFVELLSEELTGWNIRVGSILIVHSSYPSFNFKNIKIEVPFCVGVDSGQAGFFDFNSFVELDKDKELKDKWYETICNDISNKDVSIFSNGFCSSSGFGDGAYSVFKALNSSRQCIAASIVFISEDDI